MNDIVDLVGLPKGVEEMLANGTLGDPFSVLGPHETAGGWIMRAFLPGASQVQVVAREGGSVIGRLAPVAPTVLFVGEVASA